MRYSGKRESGRSDEEDQKKRPLLNSSEWAALEAGYEGTLCALHCDSKSLNCIGGNAKWGNRNSKTTEGQWSWLGALNLFRRRRPVMDITEELGVKKEEDLPDRSDGEEERDLNLSDRPRDTRLTPQEKARFQNCKDHVQQKSGEQCRQRPSGKH